MEALKLFLVKFVCLYFLQSITIVLSLYTFTKHPLDVKKDYKRFLLSSVCVLISVCLVRALPIHLGVNTLLSFIMTILIAMYINKIPIKESVKAALISTMILLICETVSITIMTYIFGTDEFNNYMNDELSKAIAGIPSTIVYFLIIAICYFIINFRVKKYKLKQKSEITDEVVK